VKKKNRNNKTGKWIFLWSVIILILFANFFGEFLGKEKIFEIAIHSVILLIGISFMFFSLKLKNKQAKKYIFFGALLIFLVELIEILFHTVFSMRLLLREYFSYNLFVEAIGILIIMKGFKEISK